MMIRNYCELEELQKGWKGKVCLFGAGMMGQGSNMFLIEQAGFHIDFFCDNAQKEPKINSARIQYIRPDDLYALRDGVLVFITMRERTHDVIEEQLTRNGITNIVRCGVQFQQDLLESIERSDDKKVLDRYRDTLDDKKYITRQFQYACGYQPDFENPVTFNEKIQWLKVYDRNPLYATLVDKYEVKKYVADLIGEEYVIPTLGVWETVDEIDWDELPEQFVIKPTHDSQSTIICTDKSNFDIDKAKRRLKQNLDINYFYYSREWAYKNVKPRIIAEKYLDDAGRIIADYKLMCFNGKVKMSFVCTERFQQGGLKVTFFDEAWNRLHFERNHPASEHEIRKPATYDRMKKATEILSRDLLFSRCDFYEHNGRVYLGEITLYPGNGMEKFTPPEWDRKVGDLLELPN